jgi:hypothetical protein
MGKAERSMPAGPKSPGPDAYDLRKAYPFCSKSVKSPGYHLRGRSTESFNGFNIFIIFKIP